MISQYVLQVGSFSLLAVLLETVMPGGSAKKYVRLVLSLLFAYVLLSPILRSENEAFSWLEGGGELTESAGEAAEYQEQADAMLQSAVEDALREQGLPPQWQDTYELVNVTAGETVEVTLAQRSGSLQLEDYDLQLGGIGVQEKQEAQLSDTLSEYWGIDASRLELRLT